MLQRERNLNEKNFPLASSALKLAITGRDGLGQCLETGVSPKYSMWVAKVQILGPSSGASAGALARRWIRSGIAKI